MNNCSFMSRKFVALGNWRWVIKNHQDSTDLFFIDLIPLIVPHFRFHVKSIHLKSIWFAHVFHLSTIWHVFSRCGFLYSILREHIKYISIFLTWTCLSWREGFLVCTFNESLFGPAFLFVWSQYKRCCYVIKADACSFRTLKIILYVLM